MANATTQRKKKISLSAFIVSFAVCVWVCLFGGKAHIEFWFILCCLFNLRPNTCDALLRFLHANARAIKKTWHNSSIWVHTFCLFIFIIWYANSKGWKCSNIVELLVVAKSVLDSKIAMVIAFRLSTEKQSLIMIQLFV